MAQLPLPLQFDSRFSLDNYIADEAPYIRHQLTALFDETGERLIGLWGGSDSGKTHLLNACALYARSGDIAYHLFDAAQLMDASAEGFSEFPGGTVLAVDNIDLLAGHRSWEAAFYQVINRVKAGELRFLFSLSRQPRDTGFKLPDLKSRLGWGLMIALPAPDDAAVERILRERARLLGLELGDDALHFLLSRFSRRLKDQMEALKKLDEAALSQQRRITIPFIREVLPFQLDPESPR
jgi:DnaA family protein